FAEVTSKQIVESFARNLMQALDVWQESGFSAAVRAYLERLARESQQSCAIDENGDLMVRPASGDTGGGASERQALLPKLKAPAWLDLAYKEPSGNFFGPFALSHRTLSCSVRRQSPASGPSQAPSCFGTRIRRHWTAKRARHSAAAFSASIHWAGRLWCRSSKPPRQSARASLSSWPNSSSATSGRRA